MNRLFKIATWNINSLRIRLAHVLTWLNTHQPHLLALQETKVQNHHFPEEPFKRAGYHVLYNGQKTYNGVAFISRIPMQNEVTCLPHFDDTQRRILVVTIGSLRIVNIYVPNGSHLGSEKFLYKLKWLKQLKIYLQHELSLHPSLIVLGDFNIAPKDNDVHDPQIWQGKVLVSPQERKALQDIVALGLKDSFRLFHNEPHQYTWWDYRAGAFRRNHGLRIDHILSSTHLISQCIDCEIDKEIRRWEKPSDHVPVIATYQNIS
ncbi:exodeoxyribonuclease III [Rickettsiella grylli]|uniref:Exodeoxyribonuclease III n=1 Tax=Rickettsiella grylli TaxID=59196 RepID=A8PPY3_9COXI|nr:exodeoxyribonuclease III [Rickettsiella grylli]EDP46272.1 exodeoxyribonuclease III [Rickettsiella grylli]